MKKLLSLVVAFLVFSSFDAFSQIIKPSGITDRPTSQLILWYDQDDELTGRSSVIQVTNTSPTQEITIHVEIERSFQFSEIDEDYSDVTRCADVDFVDTLTPLDTHIYNFSNLFFNDGEELDFIPVDDSKGFVVITPIVGPPDFRAVSFPYLTGNSTIFETNLPSTRGFKLNAMGRDAVNLSTGEIAPDFTILDGVSNGFVLIQPEELSLNINNFSFSSGGTTLNGTVDIIFLAFRDVYLPSPALYAADPSVNFVTPSLIDYNEEVNECEERGIECFDDIGLNEQLPGSNLLVSNQLLCDSTLPNLPFDLTRIIGWTRLEVTREYPELSNLLGIYASNLNQSIAVGGGTANFSFGGADWMHAKGEESIVSPAIESPCDAEDPNAIIGTEGDDVLDGTQEDDIIIGLGGNDIINGFNGNDCIDGGRGQDTISGGRGADNIFGGSGVDIISGNRGADNIVGNGGGDILKGNNGSDDIKGNGGNDEIDGGNGSDNLDGGGGTDNCINGETVINCES